MFRIPSVAVIAGAVSILLGIPVVSLAQNIGGYGDYTAWEDWPRVRLGVQAGLASSYDRDTYNNDYSWYEDPPGFRTENEIVTARTITGPGIIYRFWMPHMTAKDNFMVHMYFDGEPTPRIDSDSIEILSGSFNYFTAPLVTTAAGGQVCYEPIHFQTSLRIETENKEHISYAARHYYQYSYLTFPPGTNVASYTGSLTPEQQAARAAVVTLFDNAGQHPAGSSPTAIRLTTPATSIPAGACLTLADLSGPGLIRQLSVRMDAASDDQLHGLKLRVHYDDDTEPAIDVNVAHFFGAGDLRALYASLPIGTDSPDGFYCYWPMPFRRSMLIELCNTTAAPIDVDSGVVEYENQAVAPDSGYLRAHANTSFRVAGEPYHPILLASGCGHYVGNLLYLEQADPSRRMLEGDEVITVDGTHTLNGTGLEDAYNGGFYYNWVGIQYDEPEGAMPQSAIRPLHGIIYVDLDQTTATNRADQYRWQIADRVPFRESIDVKIEKHYAVTGGEFTSVAFWYQFPPVPADFDNDGDVDDDDDDAFEACASGPDIPLTSGCEGKDFDGDNDTDQSDFGIVQRCISGEDNPADPNCAN